MNWCALVTTSTSAGGPVTQPTFQPVSENIFPAEPMRTQRSRMPGRLISGGTCLVVEDQMLVDLVADDDGVRFLNDSRKRRQFVAVEHAADGIERRVDDDGAGLRTDHGTQCIFRQTPVRRRKLHAPHRRADGIGDRAIAVVGRLDQHDLVAVPDEPHDRCRQRFGGT